MKSYRRLFPFVLFVMIMVLMSGCIPKLKDPADFTLPSWNVPVTVPLVKTDFELGQMLTKSNESNDIIVDENTRFYTFFKDFTNDLETFEIPDLSVFTDKLEFNPDPWVSDSSLNISYAFTALPLNIDINDQGIGDILIPQFDETFRYSTTNAGAYIYVPFSKARFSNAPENELTYTLVTDEPLDVAIITLMDRYQDATGTWIEEEIGTANFNIPPNPEETSIPEATYYATISLANKIIHGQLDIKIDVSAHSTNGNISVNMPTSAILDIVELEGFEVGAGENQVFFELPKVTIPEIKLLASVPGLSEIKLKSGKIQLTMDTSASCQDHPMPFVISLDNLTITDVDENGNPIILQTSQDDGQGGWYFDMTNLSLTPNSAFSVVITPELLQDGLVYDIYEDATGEVKPYSYDFQCSIENLVIDYVAGDISQIVKDPSPETPEWDFRLDNSNSGLQVVDYPEEIADFNVGLSMIDLGLTLDNNTDFEGNFNIKINAYDDAEAQILTNSAQFDLNVLSRTNNNFDFTQGELYNNLREFINIINSRPKYYEVIYGGGLGFNPDSFRFGSGDYITPGASIAIPIAISVAPGGATVKNVFQETINDSSLQEMMEQINEFVEQASLHVKYRNTSTLGFGGNFTFTAAGKDPVTISTVLYNKESNEEYHDGELVFTVDSKLLDILSSETGFNISADLIIPNESETEWRDMGLKDTDSLSITVWVDGTIKAHVPDQM